MRHNFLVVVLGMLGGCMTAQDFHFSQFNENPMLVNPALAGANYVMRTSIVYRDQWSSVTTPFRSYGFSFDSRFKASNWEQADPKRSMIFKKSKNRLAGGLSVYNDKAGDAKLGTLQFNVSLAAFVPLNKNSNLSLGLQGGITQRKMDNTALLYGSQFNGTVYDPNLASGERYTRQSFTYPDLGTGIAYTFARSETSIAANNQINAQVGLAAFHLARPSQNMTGGESDRLYRKYVFHGNLLFGIPNTLMGIAPSWLVQVQGPSKEIVAGVMMKYYIKDDSKYTGFLKRSSVGLGVYYRAGDAVITNLLIEVGRFAVGLGYDFNTSGLARASNGQGGFEITLRMVTPNAFLYQRKTKAMFN